MLLLSLAKDRKKTKAALMKAWKSLENILPQLLTVLLIIGSVVTLHADLYPLIEQAKRGMVEAA